MNAVLPERSSDVALEFATSGAWSALTILLLTFKRKLTLMNCVKLCLFSLFNLVVHFAQLMALWRLLRSLVARFL